MLLSITHKTELTYTKPVSESVIEVRQTPRSNPEQTLRRFHLSVSPDARCSSHVDWLGNTVHHFSILPVHSHVLVVSSALVETHPEPVNLEGAPDPVRSEEVSLSLRDYLVFEGTTITNDPRLSAIAERLGLHRVSRACQAVDIVRRDLQKILRYQRGLTSSATPLAGCLDHGAGVCQDFSHLGIALLRFVGIPARYVSGYTYRPDLPEVETHAWCEAFIPSIGWVGLDPTHGEHVGEQHISVALGRDYADVPPNRGVYRGEAEESINVAVTLERVEEQTPFGAHLPLMAPQGGPERAGAPGDVAYPEGQWHQQKQPGWLKAPTQQQRQQQQ